MHTYNKLTPEGKLSPVYDHRSSSMAQSGSLGSGFRLDIQQIQLEAQHRWLRPAEICEILWNYKNFRITSEPPSQPPSGSLFLFDRNALRYFRKDGYNWRKKKDGKTVKEAHEKLKVGSVDMLHCYYAHGEDNKSFQRRSYWMLEQDSHIVFVHYLEVKGNKTNINHVKETEKALSNSPIDSQSPFSFSASHNVSTSPTSTLTSTYEDTESEDNHQVSSRYNSLPGAPSGDSNIDAGYPNWVQSIPQMDHLSPSEGDRSGDSCHHSFVSKSQRTLDLAFWQEFLEHCTEDIQDEHSESLIHPDGNASKENILKPENGTVGQLIAAEVTYNQDLDSHLSGQAYWQIAPEDHLSQFCGEPIDQKLNRDLIYGLGNSFTEHHSHNAKLLIYDQHEQGNVQQPHYTETRYINRPDTVTGNCPVITSRPLLEDGLKKADSFSRWIAKELGEVEELSMHSNSGISWSGIETGDVLGESSFINQFELETDSLNPSLCQDQLFSIIDFSPSWAYSNSETQVMITGTFLKSQEDVANCNFSCMFGEVEVPAEMLANGVLCCHAPSHRFGIVPFYITRSNRSACSEVREFEYRVEPALDIDAENVNGNVTTDMLLSMRLKRLLSLRSFDNPNCKENLISESYLSHSELKDQLYEQRLKGKFYLWLNDKVVEDGKGPNLLDKEGQGVLHLVAALGYNWALKPTIVAGVNIDFRDVNGWTALHWAAFSGREDTVAALVSLGAAPGVLTDPSPESPLGRTPADLASSNGHKGISGFLAESSLTAHLASLTMNESKGSNNLEMSRLTAVQTVSERTASPTVAGDVPGALSLKDSLAAVCNATQAATRIHQIFRMQSLERNKFAENRSDDIGSSGKHALTFKAARTSRLRQIDGTAHAAALCIQKKFRGWKKRKEFLLIRQRIVKIQAHVRGHQVRKKYKSIIWSVGILEKVILRWRRKGSGLRGFRSGAILKELNAQEMPSEEDDYDFLKHGRKQTEERLQKALNRVRSMVQYPEGRAQYRRILTTTNKLREIKDVSDGCLSSSEFAIGGDEDMFDIETLDDDTFLSMAFD